jgi:hypothetical protein
MHGAASAFGFAFQAPQQIERGARVGPAIDDIAELHQVRRATHPMRFVVHQVDGFQNVGESIERAVDIANRDDPLGAADFAARCRGGRFEKRL